ncbi:MAG: hypothetical protein JRD89_04520 [Deltaproteobacteria bacterium]|nr:hypothetical protein [Deltaproteobacteria bacterium]
MIEYTCGGYGYRPNDQGFSYHYCGTNPEQYLWESFETPKACPTCGAPRVDVDPRDALTEVARRFLKRQATIGELRTAVKAVE